MYLVIFKTLKEIYSDSLHFYIIDTELNTNIKSNEPSSLTFIEKRFEKRSDGQKNIHGVFKKNPICTHTKKNWSIYPK